MRRGPSGARPSRRCSRAENTAAAASTSSVTWIAVHQVTRRSLMRSGTLGVDGPRDLGAEIVHVDPRRLDRPAGAASRKRGRLEVREKRRDALGAERTSTAARDRPLGPGGGGRGDEQLDAIGLQLILARRDGRAGEVDAAPTSSRRRRCSRGRAGGARCSPARAARASASCAAAARRRARRPATSASGRAAPRRTSSASPATVCPAVTTSRVGTPPLRASSVTNASCSAAWLRAEPQRWAAVLVPEQAPELRDQLGVVGVTPVDLDQQRTAAPRRGASTAKTPAGLARGDREVARGHAQLAQRCGHRGERRSPGRGAEHEPDRRRGERPRSGSPRACRSAWPGRRAAHRRRRPPRASVR